MLIASNNNNSQSEYITSPLMLQYWISDKLSPCIKNNNIIYTKSDKPTQTPKKTK